MSLREKRVKWFSILIALLPFLSYFKSPISAVDMGSFLLLFFSIFAMSQFCWYKSNFMPLYLYVMLVTPFVISILSEYNTSIIIIILRYIKFVVVLGCVFGFGFFKNFYDEKITFKIIKFVIYLCAAFIVLQQVFHSIGITIENPLIRFATNDAYLDNYSMGKFLFRPSALFLEPSHLATYGLVFLVYSLFKKDNLKQSVVVSIMILCSGSGTGLVFGMLIYCSYFFMRFRKHTIKIFTAMCACVIAILSMSRMTFFKQVVNRFATDNVAGGGNAIQGRIGIGYELFLDKDWVQQLFGSGYGNVPDGVYLNGMTYILNTIGVIGSVIFFLILLIYIYKGETWQKIGLLCFLGLTFGAQTFTPASLAFSFCIYDNHQLEDQIK